MLAVWTVQWRYKKKKKKRSSVMLVFSFNHDFSLFQSAESLARINSALANTASKRERVKILHKKSEQIQLFDYYRSYKPTALCIPVYLLCCLFFSWRSAEVYRSTIHRPHCRARCNETGVYFSRSVVFNLNLLWNLDGVLYYCFSGSNTAARWKVHEWPYIYFVHD